MRATSARAIRSQVSESRRARMRPRRFDRACRRRCSAGPGIFGTDSAASDGKSVRGQSRVMSDRGCRPCWPARAAHTACRSRRVLGARRPSSGSRGERPAPSDETHPAPVTRGNRRKTRRCHRPQTVRLPGRSPPPIAWSAVCEPSRRRPRPSRGDSWRWPPAMVPHSCRCPVRRRYRAGSASGPNPLRSRIPLRPRFHRHPSRRGSALRLLRPSRWAIVQQPRRPGRMPAASSGEKEAAAAAVPLLLRLSTMAPAARLRARLRSHRRPLVRDS